MRRLASAHDGGDGREFAVLAMKFEQFFDVNIGNAVAVLSRAGGFVRVLGKRHDPLNRDETQRIRAAEGFVVARRPLLGLFLYDGEV